MHVASLPISVADATAIARDGYVFGYPLVLMDRRRRGAPVNRFTHAHELPGAGGAATSPDTGLLRSAAWLDLGPQPVVPTVPDTYGRCFALALVDGWGDVFASVGSRTTGSRGGAYAICGPAWRGELPDALTVILDSNGFGDLLERAEFLKRISDQDREITDRVRGLRDKAKDQAVQLADLEEQEQLTAERILYQRDQIAAVENKLVGSRDQLASARADKRGALAQVRESRVALEGDLAALEKEQARVQAALQGAGQTFDGPIRHGSGALIWPVNGPVVSPFGMRWGRLHAGIDIAVPSGTAIHAADSGRVVLMGWVGGYGNYTCIQHTASMSTCYAHQSSFATSNGASVSQGQVIGYSDCTGHCFGPHLHFEVRINGSPVDPMGYL